MDTGRSPQPAQRSLPADYGIVPPPPHLTTLVNTRAMKQLSNGTIEWLWRDNPRPSNGFIPSYRDDLRGTFWGIINTFAHDFEDKRVFNVMVWLTCTDVSGDSKNDQRIFSIQVNITFMFIMSLLYLYCHELIVSLCYWVFSFILFENYIFTFSAYFYIRMTRKEDFIL